MNKPFTSLHQQNSTVANPELSYTSNDATKVIWKTILLTILMLTLLLGYNKTYAQTVYCTMVCNDNLNISVDNTCSVTIRYDQIMEDADNSITCTPNGPQAFKIEVMDENLNVIPTSPTIPYEYVGRTLTVKVKHWATGNNCWSTITLQDKIPPRLTCPSNITIACSASIDPTNTGTATVADCGLGSNVTYEDEHIDLGCNNPLSKIRRIWTATDIHGNTAKCTQEINIERPNINYVVFPKNRDGISDAAVSCTAINADPNKIQPAYTGYPTLNGQAISSSTSDICKLNVDFEDQTIDACSGSYKILRKWRVLNWCTSEIKEAIQIIKVEDNTPPLVTAPADITIGTQSTACFANVPLLPATISDACSDEISVKVTSRFNPLHSNGGTLLNVPVGTHLITYEATDACGNKAEDSMKLTVEDDDPPVVVCNDETVVSLTSDGTATVFAASFDGGTHDNCCLEQLVVRRVGDDDFGPSVKFMCLDAEVMVELKAIDCHGNENSCMVNVSIQDKVEPTIICPADQTIDCEADYSDLSQFGQPQIIDNCGFEIVETIAEDLNNCGQGTIKRTWTAKGNGGGITACTQTIHVINASPWNLSGNQIIWPKDYETSQCLTATALEPEDLPEGFNKPAFNGDNECSLIATNYEDLVLEVEAPACFKILRTWTVIDWCQYEVNNSTSTGRYEHKQIIKVIDNTNPVFAATPTDITIDITGDNCSGTIQIPSIGVSDCSPNATVKAQGTLGDGFGPFTNVQPGVYDMKYIASDGCGNTIEQAIKITVKDAKKPTPICTDGLVMTLMPAANGNLARTEIWAKDLDAKSFDNCTSKENLQFRIRKHDATATTIPDTDNIAFTCDELGAQQVQVWVIDESGNADFCITTLDIQDNQKVCGDSLTNPTDMIALSGKVATVNGTTVNEVKVQVTHPDKAPYVTGDDGIFKYEQLPGNLDYALIPEKNTAHSNGVSTLDIIKMRKHLLGIKYFDSPYKLIAADVDQSGIVSTLDLIQTRKLILGLTEDFPNNESWRFVPKSYQFEADKPALQQDFPEIAIVPKEATNKSAVDFVAIKIGDVDYTAQSNGFTNGQDRNANKILYLEIENQTFEAGEIVELSFTAKDFKDILGYQFEMNFDTKILEYQDLKQGVIQSFTEGHIGTKLAQRGFINVSWDEQEGLNIEDGNTLFTFQFKAKKAGQLDQLITFSDKKLAAQAYTQKEEVLNLQLKFQDSQKLVDHLILEQNQPNPFYDYTVINFSLPKAQSVNLSIFDVQGKVLKQYGSTYEKGQHTITVHKKDLPVIGGILYYALETEHERLIKKMIILK